MKVLIIEDENPIALSLKKKLLQLRPDAIIAGITTDIQGSKEAIAANPDLDLILSDIRIDDGQSFSVFDNIDTNALIVFTTAYDEFALKAFDYNCVDYLVKPVSIESLERALLRCEKRVTGTDKSLIDSAVEQIILRSDIYRRRLLIKRGEETIIADVHDICYILSEKGITRVFLKNGEWGDVYSSLLQLSKELPPQQFIQISRQAVVHPDCVEKIKSGPGRDTTVYLKEPYEKISFVITQERKKSLLKLL